MSPTTIQFNVRVSPEHKDVLARIVSRLRANPAFVETLEAVLLRDDGPLLIPPTPDALAAVWSRIEDLEKRGPVSEQIAGMIERIDAHHVRLDTLEAASAAINERVTEMERNASERASVNAISPNASNKASGPSARVSSVRPSNGASDTLDIEDMLGTRPAPPADDDGFVDRLSALLSAKGLSYRDVGAAIGTSGNAVGQWLRRQNGISAIKRAALITAYPELGTTTTEEADGTAPTNPTDA